MTHNDTAHSGAQKRAAAINRVQNLAILLLTFSALLMVLNVPLFGALSDLSLFELLSERLRPEALLPAQEQRVSAAPVAPVRVVMSNGFERTGADVLTTYSDLFERSGALLGEAVGSAYGRISVGRYAFLSALSSPGLYFDFNTDLPVPFVCALLGVDAPDSALPSMRRLLLCCPEGMQNALLFTEGGGSYSRFNTAVSAQTLLSFLETPEGERVSFAADLGAKATDLSPLTLAPERMSVAAEVTAANPLSESGVNALLSAAEFSTHLDNRFTESSGVVIVREVNSTLHLHPDGTVTCQGTQADPQSVFFVPSAEPGSPTLYESASAAQSLLLALTRDLSGDALLCLSGAEETDGGASFTFDYYLDGVPVRFADGAHAAVATVQGQSIVSFSLRARRYELPDDAQPALLLPLPQAAAVAAGRGYRSCELRVAYLDSLGDSAPASWVAE